MNILYKLQRYGGVLGIIVLWSSVTVAMRRVGLGLIDARPLSYLGIDPISSMLFSSGLIISSLLFIKFAFWVKRSYHINNRFLTYFLIGQAGQLITAITPYGDNSQFKLIHTLAAYSLAFSLPFLIREFARSQIRSPRYPLFRKLLLVEIVTFIIGISVFSFTAGIAPLGEALPTIGFHLWIIVITFIKSSPARQAR